jgi:hypothetical protein
LLEASSGSFSSTRACAREGCPYRHPISQAPRLALELLRGVAPATRLSLMSPGSIPDELGNEPELSSGSLCYTRAHARGGCCRLSTRSRPVRHARRGPKVASATAGPITAWTENAASSSDARVVPASAPAAQSPPRRARNRRRATRSGRPASRVDHDHLISLGGGRETGVELRVDYRQSTAEEGCRRRCLEQLAGDDLLDHA